MLKLEAKTREERRKKSANRLIRKNGKIPAVVYGKNIGNTPVQVDELQFMQLLRKEGKNVIFQLNWGSDLATVMVGEVQSDPIKNIVKHIDFFEVNMKEERYVEIPLEVIGESAGEKEGGILQKQYQTIEVKCLPTNIPDSLQADISSLEIGDSFTVENLSNNADYEIQLDADTVLVSILPPAKEEEAEPAEVDPDAEPELVEQDKSDGEAKEEADPKAEEK